MRVSSAGYSSEGIPEQLVAWKQHIDAGLKIYSNDIPKSLKIGYTLGNFNSEKENQWLK